MNTINYVIGDATQPLETTGNPKIITHICNNNGAWGRGFVMALSKKWPETKSAYKEIEMLKLGAIQIINVENNTFVINMIAQNGIRGRNNPKPIDYNALKICITSVFKVIPDLSSIHMPRIGCGLAGGKWVEVEKIIKEGMKINTSINVYVYDMPTR